MEGLPLHQMSLRWTTLHHYRPVYTAWAYSWETHRWCLLKQTTTNRRKHTYPQHVHLINVWWTSPHLLGLWDAVSLVLSLSTQFTQVHLGLQGHLKAARVHHLHLQPQAWEVERGSQSRGWQLTDIRWQVKIGLNTLSQLPLLICSGTVLLHGEHESNRG